MYGDVLHIKYSFYFQMDIPMAIVAIQHHVFSARMNVLATCVKRKRMVCIVLV